MLREQKRKKMKADVLKFMEREGIMNDQVVKDRLIKEKLGAGESVEDLVFVGDANRQLLYRRNSFKRLLKNDSLKYFENGQ